jgi:hypothetical protein
VDGLRLCLFNSIKLNKLIAPVPRITNLSPFPSCEIRSPMESAGDRDLGLEFSRVARSPVRKNLTRVRPAAQSSSMDASITNRRGNCKQF